MNSGWPCSLLQQHAALTFVSLQYHGSESTHPRWFSGGEGIWEAAITFFLHSRPPLWIMITVIIFKQKSFLDTGPTSTRPHHPVEADLTGVGLVCHWLLVWRLVLVSCFPYGGDYIALCSAFISEYCLCYSKLSAHKQTAIMDSLWRIKSK